jgi:hypothetical protein
MGMLGSAGHGGLYPSAGGPFGGYLGRSAPAAATRPVPNAQLEKLLGPIGGGLLAADD